MKNYKIIFALIIMVLLTGCGRDSSHDNDNKIPGDDVTIGDESSNDTLDDEFIEYDFEGEVDEYLRYYKNLNNSNVVIKGLWDSNSNVLDVRSANYIKLNLNQDMADVNTLINQYARIYVYGKSTIVNNQPIIEVENIEYINPTTEAYWSNSVVLNQELISNAYINQPNPDTEYEMTAVVLSDNYIRVLGTQDEVCIDNTYNLNKGDTIQILVNDLRCEENIMEIRASLIEYNIITK